MTTRAITIAPTQFDLRQILNDETFVDAVGGIWTRGRTGNRWMLTLTYKALQAADRRQMWADIAEARGMQNRIQVNMGTLDYTRAGAGGGSPLLNGAHTSGDTTLTIYAATAAVTDWLEAGDFVSVGNELKMVTTSVNTDGGGSATIEVWPELHQDRAGDTAVEISNPLGVFFLRDAQGMGAVPNALNGNSEWLTGTLTLQLEEDVYS